MNQLPLTEWTMSWTGKSERRPQPKGKTLNKTIKGLLEQALEGRRSRREESADLFGCWSATDLAEFEEATKDLRQIDPDDWKSRRKSRNRPVKSADRESDRGGRGASRLGGQ